MNFQERKAANERAFKQHEKMGILFASLPSSTDPWDDDNPDDEDEQALVDELEEEGFLIDTGEQYALTPEGREALIQYIQGH